MQHSRGKSNKREDGDGIKLKEEEEDGEDEGWMKDNIG